MKVQLKASEGRLELYESVHKMVEHHITFETNWFKTKGTLIGTREDMKKFLNETVLPNCYVIDIEYDYDEGPNSREACPTWELERYTDVVLGAANAPKANK